MGVLSGLVSHQFLKVDLIFILIIFFIVISKEIIGIFRVILIIVVFFI
jgi:hypothetical protein